MKMRTAKNAAALFLISLALLSCSLNYLSSASDVEERVPELVFIDATFTRYENRVRTIDFSASQIEQYSKGAKFFAENADFTIFDQENKVETTGKCGLLSADNKNEIYEFFDGIHITNAPREIELTAEALRWNKKTEQLTGSLSDTLSIFKNDTSVQGKGFSASAITNSFSFENGLSGIITAKDDED